MARSRSTSVDVARLAGVSRATVSYVLNGRTDQSIPEETRQRVWRAARELEYVPNAASRALRGGRSRLVLLVDSGVPWSMNIAGSEDRLTSVVARSGRSLVVWHRPGPDDLASTLANLEPCVVITLTPLSEGEERLLETVGIPLVQADPRSPGADLAVRAQLSHLMAAGHRRLAYLTSSDPDMERFAEPRVHAFRAMCADEHLPEPRVGAVPGGLAVDVAEIKTLLSEWTLGTEPVTAVACYNDVHAIACFAAATELGLSVPGALSVIGLDDDVWAPFTTPALSSVRMDPPGFADHLWASALHRLGEGPEPAPYTADVRLSARASVGPLPANH